LLEFFFGKKEPLQSGFIIDFIEDIEINMVMESGVECVMESVP